MRVDLGKTVAVLGIVALAACSKADDKTQGRSGAKGQPNEPSAATTKAQAVTPTAPPSLGNRLTAFAQRAKQAAESVDVAELQKIAKEGSSLMSEVVKANDPALMDSEPLREARAAENEISNRAGFLSCAASDTAAAVATCLERELGVDAAFWSSQALLCKGLIALDLSAAPELADNKACVATSPSYDDILTLVHDQSPSLAKADLKKWLGQERAVIAKLWASFAKSDASKAYWAAVGDALHSKCAGIEDGEIDAGGILAVGSDLQELGGEAVLDRLPTTSYQALLKDSGEQKGKVLKARGQVLSISKDGEYFRGQIIDGSYRSYMFATSGSTDGIFENSYVTVRGVVTQIEQFETQGGGSNTAPVIVGYIKK